MKHLLIGNFIHCNKHLKEDKETKVAVEEEVEVEGEEEENEELINIVTISRKFFHEMYMKHN